MKPIYFLAPVLAISPVPAQTTYTQSSLIERDKIEIIYLPNNTCHVRAPQGIKPAAYRDYVRACMNNRHLHIKINNIAPN